MSSQDIFVRDPREVPFLNEQVQKLLVLADTSARGIRVKEVDDFGFMTMQFLYKQMQHAESVLRLVPSRDSGLIARAMIDGLYQLLWASHAPDERGKRWRSFAIIHDWRLMQRRIKEGLPVKESDIRQNASGLQEFGDLHRTKNPKPNAKDPYHRYWRGGVSLSGMADIVGRELYDVTYADLSDWEHWGVAGIGDSMSRNDNHVTINHDSERVAGLSLLSAFQCLLQTLQIADQRLPLNITAQVQAVLDEFTNAIDSDYRKVPKTST